MENLLTNMHVISVKDIFKEGKKRYKWKEN
jgi:hypothetical protein